MKYSPSEADTYAELVISYFMHSKGCEISGSHGSKYEDDIYLGYSAM
jgi:hypothetical protein